MSESLFINCQQALERMESRLRTLGNFHATFSSHKTQPINGRESKMFYTATLMGKKHDGTVIKPITIDGESYPDLFEKIADKIV